MNIKLQFYGIFNDYLSDEIIINLNENSTIAILKDHIKNNILVNDLFFLNTLLEKSIFSNNVEILSLDYVLKSNDNIYLLPPFSGG